MKLLTTTIALTLAAGIVVADGHMDKDNMIRTRDITGAEVYTTNGDGSMDWDPDLMYDAVDDKWDNIGEVEDIVLNRDGELIGVIAEVGGFLDIGDKHVFIETAGMKLVPVDDRSYSIVTGLSKDQLMEQEDLDEGFWD